MMFAKESPLVGSEQRLGLMSHTEPMIDMMDLYLLAMSDKWNAATSDTHSLGKIIPFNEPRQLHHSLLQ